MAILNINTDALVIFTNKLEKMHRSALPLAIRGTLNNAAFDVKQKTMPKSAASTFTERKKNFFKANSRVEMAKGFNINKMASMVGFISNKLKGENFAVKDLEQQEHGGTINKKSFIPLDSSRGGNKARPVRPINRLSKISNIVNQKNLRGPKKQRFIKAARKAGVGGVFLGGTSEGKETLFRVKSISKRGFRLIPIYSFKKGRNVKVKPTFFMKKASIISAKKMNRFFIDQAKRQFNKIK